METKEKHYLDPSSEPLEINETLTMMNTMYQEKTGEFIKKYAEIALQALVDKKGSKKIGVVKLDLSQVLSGLSQQFFPISDCPDKKGSVCISVKCLPIGDVTIVDNISEASAHSNISMGTEGDYSGPLLNESNETDEESKRNQSASLKPPRKARKNSYQEPENSDNVALIKVLEKENFSIKNEKDQLKMQLAVVLEKSKSEREQYCEYVEKIEKELDALKKQNSRLARKSEKLKEKNKEAEKQIAESLSEFEVYKLKYNHSETKALKADIKSINSQNEELLARLTQLNLSFEASEKEKHKIQTELGEVKAANENLYKEMRTSKEQTLSNVENALDLSLPQNNYRKKTQEHMNKIKQELKEAQEEIEELRFSQTENISQIHSLKIAFVQNEENFKQQIRGLEKDIKEKNEEISELNSRLDEEIQSIRHFERKTLTEKSGTDEKISKIHQEFKSLAQEKEEIEQKYIELQRATEKNKALIDQNIISKLEASLQQNLQETNKLQNLIKEKEQAFDDLKKKLKNAQSEKKSLEEHLQKASVSEFSDPATSVLKEQNLFLESKLSETQEFFSSELSKANNEKSILEKMMKISDEKHSERIKSLEEKIQNLNLEILNLKEKKKTESVVDFISLMNEENYKEEIKVLDIQNSELKNSLIKTTEELKNSENKAKEFKLYSAKMELEKENLQVKYREAQEQLRDYSNQYTILEVELYKINDRFGHVLNINNQLENEIQDIKEQVFLFKQKKK